VLQRREVDIAGGFASRTLNLQPGEAAVDGLVDGRRRINRLAVAPHPLVPASAEKFVGLLDQRFALRPHLGRLGGKDAGHHPRFPELLGQSLPVTARKGRRMIFRGHPDIQAQRIGQP
jgi:hypothetical protein